MTLNLKARGDLAELKVATDLASRGYKVALPYGEDWDYDLIVDRGDGLERVQVKHARSDGAVITVKCASHSLTNGKVRAKKQLHRRLDRLARRVRPGVGPVLLRSRG